MKQESSPAGSGAEPFAREAESEPGLLREMLVFLRHEKKWFLTPIVIILLLAGLFLILSDTTVAPFIYTVF